MQERVGPWPPGITLLAILALSATLTYMRWSLTLELPRHHLHSFQWRRNLEGGPGYHRERRQSPQCSEPTGAPSGGPVIEPEHDQEQGCR